MSETSKGLAGFGRLAIVLDLTPASWASLFAEQTPSSEASLGLSTFLDHILAFSRQYSMLNRNNRISLISMSPKCHVHYPVHINDSASHTEDRVSATFNFTKFHNCFKKMVLSLSHQVQQDSIQSLPLSVALTRAFLYLNRQDNDLCAGNDEETDLELPPLLLGSSNFPARIVVFSLTEDTPSQVLPTMNAIFACHKQSITIDSVFLSKTGKYSPLLQVASELTSGYNCSISTLSELQRLMLTVLLVDAPLRLELKMPKLVHVDHRATCFCHKRSISLGYVCSVCLAVFCEPCQPCSICGVSFAEESLPSQRLVDMNEITSEPV